jgi:hypothetical protein
MRVYSSCQGQSVVPAQVQRVTKAQTLTVFHTVLNTQQSLSARNAFGNFSDLDATSKFKSVEIYKLVLTGFVGLTLPQAVGGEL